MSNYDDIAIERGVPLTPRYAQGINRLWRKPPEPEPEPIAAAPAPAPQPPPEPPIDPDVLRGLVALAELRQLAPDAIIESAACGNRVRIRWRAGVVESDTVAGAIADALDAARAL